MLFFGVCFFLYWFTRYLLNDRRQSRLIIKNALSDPSVITSGVPQGSILGPLIFL